METSLGQSALYVNKIFSAEQMLAIGEIRRLSCRPGFPCLGIRRFCSFRSSTWLGIRRFSSVEGKDSIFAEAAKTPSSSSRFGRSLFYISVIITSFL
jgi:hypothetical protein